MKINQKSLITGLLGSIVGAGLGSTVFYACWEFGLYVPFMIFLGTGLGSAFFLRERHGPSGFVAMAVGLIANILTEWNWRPFEVDNSLGYYITHLHQLGSMYILGLPIPWYVIWIVGLGLAFWFGRGHHREPLDPPAPHIE